MNGLKCIMACGRCHGMNSDNAVVLQAEGRDSGSVSND
jgi:hypothetical protein